MLDRIRSALRRNTQAGRPPKSLAKSWRLHLERLEDRALMAADANLVAYRPVTDYINYALHPVAETLESDAKRGPGIRVNGDDDNANKVADYLDRTTASTGDNDLVRVDALGTGTAFSVAWTGFLAVWSSPTKTTAIVNGGTIAEDQSLWVEYTSQTHTVGASAALTLTVTDATTTAIDSVVFHSFQSVVIAIGGNIGDLAGINMLAGSIFLFGDSGIRHGAGMKRGTIAFLGNSMPPLLPTFRRACRFRPEILQLSYRHLRCLEFPVPDDLLTAFCDIYNGDFLTGGRGELLFRAA
jgi:hypothetical protein